MREDNLTDSDRYLYQNVHSRVVAGLAWHSFGVFPFTHAYV
jgi:hypothetical protein